MPECVFCIVVALPWVKKLSVSQYYKDINSGTSFADEEIIPVAGSPMKGADDPEQIPSEEKSGH